MTDIINIDGRHGRARSHTYLPLNRRYKPLGLGDLGHVNYLNFPQQFIRFICDPSKIEGVWWDTWGAKKGTSNVTGAAFYLYNDSRASHESYSERYGRLLHYLNCDWLDIRSGEFRFITRDEARRRGVVGA